MFFVLSKLLAPLESPGNVLLLTLAVGAMLCWFNLSKRAGRFVVTTVTIIFFVVTLSPLYEWVAAPLENRFPRPLHLPSNPDGIIVLGGAVNPIITTERATPTLNSDAEVMTEFVALARSYPNAQLVFTGGNPGLFERHNIPEAAVAKLFFRQQGLDVEKIKFESRSRTTYENALLSKALIRPRERKVWLLVTSAMHMPRAVGAFTSINWAVVPVPVAYKTSAVPGHDFALNLSIIDAATHEWLGLVAYRLTGKTSSLFPSPTQMRHLH